MWWSIYFHYLLIQISIIVLCAFVSLCWVPGWCNWLLSISWFAPGSWSWTHHRLHVVQLLLYIVHHFPWKNMVIRSCAPSYAGTHPGYWGVGCGLRWDDDARKSRIMCLWCQCRCLRRMKGLSRGWGWLVVYGIAWSGGRLEYSGRVVWWVVRYKVYILMEVNA